MSEFLRFATIGSVGFLVDAGCLLLFVALGAMPLSARIASFVVAASVTFVLHHRFTFRVDGAPSMHGWSTYLLLTAVGALVNLGVYQLWIDRFGVSAGQLVLGAAAGSAAALCLNFTVSRTLIFGRAARKES